MYIALWPVAVVPHRALVALRPVALVEFVSILLGWPRIQTHVAPYFWVVTRIP